MFASIFRRKVRQIPWKDGHFPHATRPQTSELQAENWPIPPRPGALSGCDRRLSGRNTAAYKPMLPWQFLQYGDGTADRPSSESSRAGHPRAGVAIPSRRDQNRPNWQVRGRRRANCRPEAGARTRTTIKRRPETTPRSILWPCYYPSTCGRRAAWWANFSSQFLRVRADRSPGLREAKTMGKVVGRGTSNLKKYLRIAESTQPSESP